MKVIVIAKDNDVFLKAQHSIMPALNEAMTKGMRQAQQFAKKDVSGGGSSRTKLNVRSGRLRGSIQTKVKATKNTVVGTIGSRLIYARVHEYGHPNITPKRAKALTIPSKFLRTQKASGAVGVRARDFQNTFIRNGTIFQKQGTTGRSIKPLFHLVQSVKIPKRPYLQPALESVAPMVLRRVEEKIG